MTDVDVKLKENIEINVEMNKVPKENEKVDKVRNTDLNTETRKIKDDEDNNAIKKEKKNLSYSNGTANKIEEDLQIIWENITMTAEISEGKLCNKKKYKKNILSNVSGSISSGEALAILGASGAGKTTLLNFLSHKIESTSLTVTGKVTVNSEQLDNESFSALTSYVMQDDLLEGYLTPREILLYTAKLKLKGTIEEKEKRVKYLLNLLRIDKCQNTKIGNNIERGVSGGERKRTSIAFELLSDTPIIFLDEPTTGLDSYNAYEVIKIIRDLATINNKIVVFTIHQPASEIFELLDKLCVLSLGKTVYFGPAKGIYSYFEATNNPIHENYNPFEHIIEATNWSAVYEQKVIESYPKLLEIEGKTEKYNYLIDEYNKLYTERFNFRIENTHECISQEIKDDIKDRQVVVHGFFYQLYILILKTTTLSVRNKHIMLSKILQYFVFSIIMALVFNNIKKDNTGVRDKLGIHIICSMVIIFNTINSFLLVCKLIIKSFILKIIVTEDRGVFIKERAAKLYSVPAYFFSKVISFIPLNIVGINFMIVFIYFPSYLNDSYGYKFWSYLGIIQLIGFVGVFYTLFIASMSTNQESLAVINIVSILYMIFYLKDV